MNYTKSPSRLRNYAKDPRSLYYYFNKLVRNDKIRKGLFKTIVLTLPKQHVVADRTDLERIENDGIVLWDALIDAPRVERLREFFSTKPVFDIRDTEKKAFALSDVDLSQPRKLNYFPEDIVACEDIIAIANDAKILALVAAYFSCKPTITIMDAWWTKAGSQPAQNLFQDDMFHRDVEDFKFIKLFVYLTDVAPENGAHCFVKGSQRSSKLTARRPLPDELIEHEFPVSNRLVITGNAGTGFLEDTWGLHRSLPVKSGSRLLLSVTYSLTSLNPQSPAAPIAENCFGVDPYINRVYLK